MTRDRGPHPARVYLGGSMTEAQLCVAFLRGMGIPAEVENPETLYALDGIATRADQREGYGVVVPSAREAEAADAVRAFEEGAAGAEEGGRPGGDGEE